MKSVFGVARREDLKDISEIERLAFAGTLPEDELFTEEKLQELLDINPEMIYVLRDPETNKVNAFTIVSPITKECYDLFMEDKVQDLVSFNKEEKNRYIKKTNNSEDFEYSYFTDICTRKSKKGKVNKLLSLELLVNIMSVLMEKEAQNITAFPVTDEGKNILLSLKFNKVNDNIYELNVTPEILEYYASYMDRAATIFNRKSRKNK